MIQDQACGDQKVTLAFLTCHEWGNISTVSYVAGSSAFLL